MVYLVYYIFFLYVSASFIVKISKKKERNSSRMFGVEGKEH